MALDVTRSELLVIDVQPRLMAVIDGAEPLTRNLRRLVEGARRLGVPVDFTEQNSRALGATLPELGAGPDEVTAKMTFDALGTPEFADRVNPVAVKVVTGVEAHICVTQTVLGLLGRGMEVYVVADAIGSRAPASHAAALARMARHGAEIVTTEMVLFEWLGTAAHPEFKAISALIK
jgi:nicotinamidase-related amidase